MRKLNAFAITLSALAPGRLTAGSLAQEQAALALIQNTADKICVSVPIDQKASRVELTGNAKAKLSGAIGRIADLGIAGAARYVSQSSQGLLQRDVAVAIKNGNDCRVSVLSILSSKILPSTSTASSKHTESKRPRPSAPTILSSATTKEETPFDGALSIRMICPDGGQLNETEALFQDGNYARKFRSGETFLRAMRLRGDKIHIFGHVRTYPDTYLEVEVNGVRLGSSYVGQGRFGNSLACQLTASL